MNALAATTTEARATGAPDLVRRVVAEALGTALLLATVVGSGIMAERLAGGNVALALLANALATGGGLVALLLTLGPVSGAHFNPVVSMAAAALRELSWRDAMAYVLAQVGGAAAGVVLAHAMFAAPLVSFSRHVRSGPAQALSELVATFGLVMVIHGVSRTRAAATPYAVAAYIVAAYWFTASTSFANPAVTLARSLTDTFAGIRPIDTPTFVAAEVIGAALGTLTMRWLSPAGRPAPERERVTEPGSEEGESVKG